MFILSCRGVGLGSLVVFDGKFLHNLKKMVSCMPHKATHIIFMTFFQEIKYPKMLSASGVY